MIRATRELDYSSAYIRSWEPDKSEDNSMLQCHRGGSIGPDADARQWIYCHGLGNAMVPQRRDFLESSIPCYHGGRALVVKGVEKIENIEANSKYQDKVNG
ncbi:hypothetical protein B296_00052291 [Ensete ventricosum]|uniref:Uncharacterized protein n=1 Tax=Ensete ventricosum TaxID=4639 RepID=A0A426YCY9_ENSVE|nr:hypothetical protein B296_00052291 [Ensete ventricosum]